MCSSKYQSFHKNALHMVLRPNIGRDLIYNLCPIHLRPRCTSHEKTTCKRALAPTVVTPLGIEKFDSNVFHFLILTNSFLMLFCTHFYLVLLSLFHGSWRVRKWKLHLGQRLSEVYLANSQFVPIMGFEYIKGLPTNPYRVHLGPRLE